MTGGILLAIAGVWLGAQVIGGDLTGRIGITKPGNAAPTATAAAGASAGAVAAAAPTAPSTPVTTASPSTTTPASAPASPSNSTGGQWV